MKQFILNALILWATSLVPVLLPVMIISRLLIGTDVLYLLLKPFSFLYRKLHAVKFGDNTHPEDGAAAPKKKLSLSVEGLYALLVGFCCGFPMGVKTLADLLDKQAISREEAKSLACFINNVSPAFLIGYVCQDLLHAPGFILPCAVMVYGAPLVYGMVVLGIQEWRGCSGWKRAKRRRLCDECRQTTGGYSGDECRRMTGGYSDDECRWMTGRYSDDECRRMTGGYSDDECRRTTGGYSDDECRRTTGRYSDDGGYERRRASDADGSNRHHKQTGHFSSFASLLDTSIEDSLTQMLKIGGYLVFFSILSFIVCRLAVLPDMTKATISATLEISLGCRLLASLSCSFVWKYILLVGTLSFGGLCSAFQSTSFLKEIGVSLGCYLRRKIVVAVIAVGFCLIYVL